PFRGKRGPFARERVDCSDYFRSDTSSAHSDIGTYSQSEPFASAAGSGSAVATVAAAPVFFRRFRPPRVPRLVLFFGVDAAASSPSATGSASGSAGGSSSPAAGSPRSRSGTWIRASTGGAPFAPALALVAAVGFLRPRPPREPRRVFFFGVGSPASASASASASS